MELECSWCQKSFKRNNRSGHQKRGRFGYFCGPICSRIAQKTYYDKLRSQKGPTNRKCPCGNFVKRGKTYCSSCISRYMYLRFNAKKMAAVEFLGGRCKKCNMKFHPTVFNFHHIIPSTKTMEWRKMRLSSAAKLHKELNLCQLLCANCHQQEHTNFSNWEGLEKPKARFLEQLKLGGLKAKPIKDKYVQPTKINWPADEKLLKLLQKNSVLGLSKKLGVSDHAVRKRCKIRHLNYKSPKEQTPNDSP